MAKFTTFVSEMHTRTVKYMRKQPTKRKVRLFDFGSVTKFSSLANLDNKINCVSEDLKSFP